MKTQMNILAFNKCVTEFLVIDKKKIETVNYMRRVIYNYLLLTIITFLGGACNEEKGIFQIRDHAFYLNGKSVQLICGEMHYPRIPQEYWRDRIRRAKAMGINTISTYVFWNIHERQPGVFDFEGQADLAKFIKTAQEEGMYVILRPGPYVCAEWDFGGYPAWIQENKDMVYRSHDPKFLNACERYINRLGEEVADLTISNGGPILMVQVENEYGSYGNDKEYLSKLRDMLRNAGFNVPLITCDGGGQIAAGSVEGVWPTINGSTGEDIIQTLDNYVPGGPYFVAEFYPAWFDVWGQPHSVRNYEKPAKQLDWMLQHGISVSMYMFHGGTNFDYTNGANTAYGYAPQPTSYDYDAPLGEYGNATPKYYAFREVIQKYLPEGEKLPDVPEENPIISFPTVKLAQSAPLSAAFTKRIKTRVPLTMEAVHQDFGYIHYETELTEQIKDGILVLKDLRDYAVVLLNGKYVGSLDRRHRQNKLRISVDEIPARLEILVENVGRVNYGEDIQNNLKGITDKVLLNGKEVEGWIVSPLPLYQADVRKFNWNDASVKGSPAFFKGTFHLDKIGDTFLDVRGWGKGAAWINGHSLGKFWYIGPQQTLYVPGPWLKEGENEIVIFEMEDQGCRTVCGLDKPILNDVRKDKNAPERETKYDEQEPILDRGDQIYEGQMEKNADWQTFMFNGKKTLRHLCLEVLSSYDGKHSCISEIELLDGEGKSLSKDYWKILYASTEQNGEGYADQLIDGDVHSYWHSQWQSTASHFPHQLIIDLGEIQVIGGIRIKLRNSQAAGCIKDFRLYGRPQFFLFRNRK